MCEPETRQAYLVLKAFEKAGQPLYRDEVEFEVSKLLKSMEIDRIEQIGPMSLQDILNEFASDQITAPDAKKRRKLTETGRQLVGVLGSFVNKPEAQMH